MLSQERHKQLHVFEYDLEIFQGRTIRCTITFTRAGKFESVEYDLKPVTTYITDRDEWAIKGAVARKIAELERRLQDAEELN